MTTEAQPSDKELEKNLPQLHNVFERELTATEKDRLGKYLAEVRRVQRKQGRQDKEKEILDILDKHIEECEPHNCCGDEIKKEIKNGS